MKFKKLLFIVFFVFISVSAFSQNSEKVKADFIKAFDTGKTVPLEMYFKGFASIQLPDHSGLFPAIRSKMYLETFFKNHPVKEFLLKKSGTSNDNYFLIGLFKCRSSSWSVYFLFSPDKGNYKIQQIEIEESER